MSRGSWSRASLAILAIITLLVAMNTSAYAKERQLAGVRLNDHAMDLLDIYGPPDGVVTGPPGLAFPSEMEGPMGMGPAGMGMAGPGAGRGLTMAPAGGMGMGGAGDPRGLVRTPVAGGGARRGLSIASHRLGTYGLLLVVVAFPGWLLWSAATIADRTLMMTSAYYTSVVPALYALVALGLAHGRRGAVWRLAVTALVVGMAGGHGLRYYNAQHQVDWGEIMSFIDARQEPGDVIAVSPPYVQMQAQHHHHGSTPVTSVPRDFDITRHRASLPEIRLTPDKLPAAIQRLSTFNRVWFIETRRQRIDPDRTIYQALREAGREVDLGLTEAPGHLQGNVILFEMPAGSSTDEPEGGR